MTEKEIIRALEVMRDTNRIPSRTLINETLHLIAELQVKNEILKSKVEQEN